jgi:prepilin-type processing-associated H-X9-DG protein
MSNDACGVWDRRRSPRRRFPYPAGILWHLSFIIEHSLASMHNTREEPIEEPAMPPSAGASQRGGIRLGCVVVAVVLLAILFVMLLPAMWCAFDDAPRAACKNNLKQIGTACQNWAASHRQYWPDIMGTSKRWDKVGATRTDHYDPNTPGEQDQADDIPPGDASGDVNSNTANFWALIAYAGASPGMFICPHTDHIVDDRVVEYDEVRDFRNELYCSYSFQNVLGPYTLTQTGCDQPSLLAVAADASPLRRDVWSGAPGGVTRGATDRHLASEPVFGGEWETELAKRWREAGARPEPWELNSPNHGFAGQNILYLDGHVEWNDHPYCGVNHDNIWLRRKDMPVATINPEDLSTLRATNDPASYDGTSTLAPDAKNDSFLVP